METFDPFDLKGWCGWKGETLVNTHLVYHLATACYCRLNMYSNYLHKVLWGLNTRGALEQELVNADRYRYLASAKIFPERFRSPATSMRFWHFTAWCRTKRTELCARSRQDNWTLCRWGRPGSAWGAVIAENLRPIPLFPSVVYFLSVIFLPIFWFCDFVPFNMLHFPSVASTLLRFAHCFVHWRRYAID